MKKVLTIILDGFGVREDVYGNAVKNAGMNHFINIWNNYPHCLLKASEEYVGLPDGQQSCSELGHSIIGSGRKVTSKLRELKELITPKNMFQNSTYQQMLKYLNNNTQSSLHIIFMLSDGGIISHIDNLISMINVLKESKITNNIYLDLISDGVDTPRKNILKYLRKIDTCLTDNIKISSLCGRYYALSPINDERRTKIYYDLILKGEGISTNNINNIINACYNNKITDEYLPPIKAKDFSPIMDEDVILFLNHDRNSQINIFESLTDPLFDKFAIYKLNNRVYSLYDINKNLNRNYFFTLPPIKNTLSEYLSDLGITQAKIAESAKQHCITYYFDGLRDKEFKGCDLYIVKTPQVARMDKKPESNCLSVAKTIITCMEKDYDFIIANFANADLVGHTGNYQATINSLQAVDVCLGKIIEVAKDNFYKIIIVGSHANADTIINHNNEVVTYNTLSSVPFIIMDDKVKLKNGTLKSVAPTILNYMDIAIPKEMKDTELLFDKE